MKSMLYHRTSRRRLLSGAAAAGSVAAMSAVAGCSSRQTSSGGSAVSGSQAGGAKPGLVPYAAATASGQSPRKGGTIVTEWQGTTSLWDPYLVSTGVIQHYSAIFDTLVKADPKTLKVQPNLVESWEEIEPGLQYVFKVRPGIVWENKQPTNGRAFDAEDVVYNLKYADGLLDPSKKGQIARSSWYGDIASVTATDKQTVAVKLSSPNGALLAAMSDMRQFTIPKEIPSSMPFTDYAKFPSNGPFITKSYIDGQAAEYTRNPNYWDKPYPYVDAAQTKWFGDDTSAVAALLSGEINFSRIRGRQWIAQVLSSHQPIALYPEPFRAHDTTFINAQRYPDKRIWTALNYLYDKKATADAVYGAGYWEYSGPLERVLPGASSPDQISKLSGYNPATRDKDVKDGLAMLAAAGHPDGDGLAATILTAQAYGSLYDEAIHFQAALKQFAPKMKVDVRPTPDNSAFQRAIGTREFDIVSYQIYESIDARLAALNWKTGQSRNYPNYSNPEVDRLVDKALGQTTQDSLSTIQQIDKILLEGVPVIVPAGVVDTIAAKTTVRGIPDLLGPGSSGQTNLTSTSRKFVWLEG